MDNVKKMALIPQHMLATLLSQQALMAPTQAYLSDLDREMKKILDDGSIPNDVKAKRYSQALHRFMGFREQELQQLPVAQLRQPTMWPPSRQYIRSAPPPPLVAAPEDQEQAAPAPAVQAQTVPGPSNSQQPAAPANIQQPPPPTPPPPKSPLRGTRVRKQPNWLGWSQE